MKKIASILLVLVLILSAFSTIAYATSTGEEDEELIEVFTIENESKEAPQKEIEEENPEGEEDVSGIETIGEFPSEISSEGLTTKSITLTVAAEPTSSTIIAFNVVGNGENISVTLSKNNNWSETIQVTGNEYSIKNVFGDSDVSGIVIKTDKFTADSDKTLILEYEEVPLEEEETSEVVSVSTEPEPEGICLIGAGHATHVYVTVVDKDGKSYKLDFKKKNKYVLDESQKLSAGKYSISKIETKMNSEFGFETEQTELIIDEYGNGSITGFYFIKSQTFTRFLYNNWLLLLLIIGSFIIFVKIRKAQGLPVFNSDFKSFSKDFRKSGKRE